MPDATTPTPTLSVIDQQVIEGCYVVTVKATLGKRSDVDVGAFALPKEPEARAAAIMLAMNLAKRRVTRSILGKPDELAEYDQAEAASPEPAPQPKPRRSGADDANPTDEEFAAASAKPVTTPTPEPITVVTDRLKLEADVEQLTKELGILDGQFRSGLKRSYGKQAIGDCTDDELKDLHKRLSEKAAAKKAK